MWSQAPVCHSLSHGPGVWREPHSRRVQREALGECRGGGNSADAAEQAAVAGFNLLSEAFVVILQSGNRSCRTLHTPPGAFAALTWDILLMLKRMWKHELCLKCLTIMAPAILKLCSWVL